MLTAQRVRSCIAATGILFAFSTSAGNAAAKPSSEGGTWTALTNLAPDFVGTMLSLTDGTVMAQGYDPYNGWMRLTPDARGSYVNGTWSNLALMSTQRLYFASNILQNGNVWVLGGEYANNPLTAVWTNTGEMYEPLTNSWSPIAPHPEPLYGDVPSMLLSNGMILAGSLSTRNSYLYDIAANTWSPAAPKVYNDRSDEEGWVKLRDGSVLTYDLFQSVQTGGSYAERYIPAENTWVSISPSDGSAFGDIPQLSSSSIGFELGPSLRLQDGRIFVIGATGHTALYTPSKNTWAAGPDIVATLNGDPALFGADDAPGAVLPNGHVLFTADAGPTLGIFSPPTRVFDFNPFANTISEVESPTEDLDAIHSYVTRMLILPTGELLFSDQDKQLWVFTANGSPPHLLRPRIEEIKYQGGGVFTLSGQQLNGPNAGSAYGDDAENDANFPIVRLVDNEGSVFYARTTNWSTTGVATRTFRETVNFTLPASLVNPGVYKVTEIGAGISSVTSPALHITADEIAGQ
jgi:hypothetical protein